MNRISQIARLQVTPWYLTVGMSWAVLLFSFAINMVIFGVANEPGEHSTGGVLSLYIFMFVQYAIVMNQFFPFALGMSVTRTTFFAATSLLAIVQSSANAIALYLISLVEEATNGWGISLSYFSFEFLDSNTPVEIAFYTIPMLTLVYVGIFWGLIFKRWGIYGMIAASAVLAVVIGLFVTSASLFNLWPGIISWFLAQSTVTLVVGLPFALALAFAGSSLLILRRTTP